MLARSGHSDHSDHPENSEKSGNLEYSDHSKHPKRLKRLKRFKHCPLALRGNPGVFVLGASVDSALGRIGSAAVCGGSAAVCGRATGAHLEVAQSAIKCRWPGWMLSPSVPKSRRQRQATIDCRCLCAAAAKCQMDVAQASPNASQSPIDDTKPGTVTLAPASPSRGRVLWCVVLIAFTTRIICR